MQLEEVPGIDAGPEIEQFANALDDCLSTRLSDTDKRERLLNLPRKYHDNAVKRLAQLRRATGHESHDDMDLDTNDLDPALSQDVEAIKQLEREVQTWDLLRRVLPLRHPNEQRSSRLSRLEGLGDKQSENILSSFFQTNSIAKERRAVLQWLQTNATAGPDIDDLTHDLQQSADRGDIIAHGWLHTRSSIKLKKSMTGWNRLLDEQPGGNSSHTTSSGAPLVTQLDPDAAARQGRKLQPQDEYFERAISRGCYEHVRRGSSFQTIRDWCQERTEMWRAISMSGMLLSSDNDDLPAGLEPSSLALWRRMCYGLARQGGSDDYERAIYGVLSGDILSVEKVARTWDDYLFAHYNALLRTQLDSHLLDRCSPAERTNLTQSFSAFDAVRFHGEDPGLEKRLVQSLESQSGIETEASEPNKALQASIIAKEIEEYLYNQGRAMAPGSKKEAVVPKKYFTVDQHYGLRIVSHVYVLMTLLERLDSPRLGFTQVLRVPERQSAEENILAQYASFLQEAKLQELIPVYCSILDTPRRYDVLSANLIQEDSHDRRLELLNLVKRANIDVLEFVTTQATLLYEKVVSNESKSSVAKPMFQILEPGPISARFGRMIKADFFGEDPEDVEPEHEHLIRAIEYLQMVNETWPSVFSVGAKVYKFFLKHMHLRAARQLLKRVPYSGIMRVLGEEEAEEGMHEHVGFWAERLEESELQDVSPLRVMEDARNFRELEALVRALDSLETVGAFADLATEAPPGQRDFWNQVGDSTKATKESMAPLLKDWLLAGIEAGDDELKEIRQTYLPETVLAYVSALHFAGTGLTRDWLLECMHLASVVVEHQSDLEGTFVEAKRVKELLEAFAGASKALAIVTGEKRATGTSNKKLREMGWTRDLWSVN